MKRKLAIAAIVLGALYILNPIAGLFELLPDNIPFVGNVDEGLAVYIIMSSISYLKTGDANVFKKLLRRRN